METETQICIRFLPRTLLCHASVSLSVQRGSVYLPHWILMCVNGMVEPALERGCGPLPPSLTAQGRMALPPAWAGAGGAGDSACSRQDLLAVDLTTTVSLADCRVTLSLPPTWFTLFCRKHPARSCSPGLAAPRVSAPPDLTSRPLPATGKEESYSPGKRDGSDSPTVKALPWGAEEEYADLGRPSGVSVPRVEARLQLRGKTCEGKGMHPLGTCWCDDTAPTPRCQRGPSTHVSS